MNPFGFFNNRVNKAANSVIGYRISFVVAALGFLYYDRNWIKMYEHIELGMFLVVFLYTVGIIFLTRKLSTYPMFRLRIVKPENITDADKTKGQTYNGLLFSSSSNVLNMAMLILFATFLPYGAMIEELIFRQGTLNWADGILRSLLFGVLHAFIGASMGAVIVITGGGLILTYLYFQQGIALASLAHFEYNLAVVAIILAFKLRKIIIQMR